MKYVTHLNVDAKKVIRHMYYRYPTRPHTTHPYPIPRPPIHPHRIQVT